MGKGCRFFYEALCTDSGRINVKDVNTIRWTKKKKLRFNSIKPTHVKTTLRMEPWRQTKV